MFHLFGRHLNLCHGFEFALQALLERCDVFTAEDRAVAFNLMNDGGVSPERETEFTTHTGGAPSSRRLKEALIDYFWAEVRLAPSPAFLRPANHDNKVPFMRALPGSSGLHPATDLARVLSLTGLKAVFRRNIRAFPEFRELEGHDHDDGFFQNWLEASCMNGAGARDRFVEATLRMLNEDRRKHRYQPVWVTLWGNFEPFVKEGADRWRQVLGIRAEPGPSWLLVLKYKARDAGELYRPTQLDAGWNGYFFPAPAAEAYAMDVAGAAHRLLPEYIHQQTDHSLEHWIAAGRLLGRADMTDPLGLPEVRERHQELLVCEYGTGGLRWRY